MNDGKNMTTQTILLRALEGKKLTKKSDRKRKKKESEKTKAKDK